MSNIKDSRFLEDRLLDAIYRGKRNLFFWNSMSFTPMITIYTLVRNYPKLDKNRLIQAMNNLAELGYLITVSENHSWKIKQ